MDKKHELELTTRERHSGTEAKDKGKRTAIHDNIKVRRAAEGTSEEIESTHEQESEDSSKERLQEE